LGAIVSAIQRRKDAMRGPTIADMRTPN
jgi:hypothetical protein